MTRGRRVATAGFALWLVSCTSTSVVSPVSGRYDECDAPELAAAERSLARGDLADAVRSYGDLVRICPHYVGGHQRYQDLARSSGGEIEAEMRAYYEALQDDGSPVWPFVGARLQGEFDERRKQLFEEALARDASFYYAQLGLAEMWRGLGRTQNELEALESAIQAKPDAPETNLQLARVLAELGRVEEAAPLFRAYLEQRPDDREAAREYVRLLIYGRRDHDAARGWVERLLDEDPEDVAVLMDAAAVAWLGGERETAAGLYRRVLELDNTEARAALNLGNLYFLSPQRSAEDRRRDWPKARAAYRTYLEVADPHDLQDLLDLHTAVPDRLARIDEFLGADQAPVRDEP